MNEQPERFSQLWLYSFRRCPYAIRARLALKEAGLAVRIREVSLRDKPASLRAFAPVATVPVLVINAGERIISDSLAIMHFAFSQHDPEQRLSADPAAQMQWIDAFLAQFKPQLDCYKYPQRHPLHNQAHYKAQAQASLALLESRLQAQPWLEGPRATLTDMALLPFVRQFAAVEPGEQSAIHPLPKIKHWLGRQLDSALFVSVMEKYPLWQDQQLGPSHWL